MNILEVLEQYSQLCGDLEAFMNEENSLLRAHAGPDERILAYKREISHLLGSAREKLTFAEPAAPHERGALREARDRVQQKVLKLLLLSRESEQLLLKNSVSPRPAIASVKPSANRLNRVYGAPSSANFSA